MDISQTIKKITYKNPDRSYIISQAVFWICAYFFMNVILYLNSKATSAGLGIEYPVAFMPFTIISIFSGAFYGVVTGWITIKLSSPLMEGRSMWKVISHQIILNGLVLMAILLIIRYVALPKIIIPLVYNGVSPIDTNAMWPYILAILPFYTLGMSFILAFFNQMNKKFGPGILLPMVLGKYKNPVEDFRIFMFMDLKSSTSHGERLGHIKYSALLKDVFKDINSLVYRYNAEIYQYVGDEVVLSWCKYDGIENNNCIQFYFNCMQLFHNNAEYYKKHYGMVPQFKAGLHIGKVTTIEIGEIKKELAYHGDTLNTAARIQEACKEYDESVIISGELALEFDDHNSFEFKSMGSKVLRGKEIPIELFAVKTSLN